MFKLSDYTKKSTELELLNGEVIHVRAMLKRDVDTFSSIVSKISKKGNEDIEKGNKDLDKAILNILNNNEENKTLEEDFLKELQMAQYTGLMEFITSLIKDTQKKHPSQSQMTK